ncbi:MAG: DUF4160 domain-containing protein [Cyclobacteriaceae bacterium]|jgi:hypothetical protein
MPKIFEYLGIILFFYANEHEPIHVHARKGEFETKAEFIILNGKVVEIRLRSVKGAKPLKGADLKNFKVFLDQCAESVVQKWIDFFVLKKNVAFEKITKKLR